MTRKYHTTDDVRIAGHWPEMKLDFYTLVRGAEGREGEGISSTHAPKNLFGAFGVILKFSAAFRGFCVGFPTLSQGPRNLFLYFFIYLSTREKCLSRGFYLRSVSREDWIPVGVFS